MKAVLVSSVKGGTGKSLFSINLALQLKEKGYRVGLLDADFTSPYFKVFTKAELKVEVRESRGRFVLRLPEWNGIKVFSLGLIQEGATSFYGYVERQILQDLRDNADWGKLDYLIIDLPAGAEDVFRETIRLWGDQVSGGIVIMIPFAEKSARSLIELWQFFGVPILGLVENMAYFKCPGGEVFHPFGRPVGEALAREYGVDYLGQIPLDPRVARRIEQGDPRLPEDIAGPVLEAVARVEASKPQALATRLRRAVKESARRALAKVIGRGLILVNRRFDIAALRRKYGFPGGRVIALVITDLDEKPLLAANFKLAGDRIVLVKGEVRPDVVIEAPVKTIVDIIRGKRRVAGREVPFDVKTAWAIGELKVYGAGTTGLLLKVLNTMLKDEELLREVRGTLEPLLRLLG